MQIDDRPEFAIPNASFLFFLHLADRLKHDKEVYFGRDQEVGSPICEKMTVKKLFLQTVDLTFILQPFKSVLDGRKC